jgi:hypothetical protein
MSTFRLVPNRHEVRRRYDHRKPCEGRDSRKN